MKADLLWVLSHLKCSYYTMLSPRLFFRWIFMSTPAIVIHANLFSLKVLCVLFKCFNPNVSRVLSRVKQTIASIKLVIGIGKEGRQTVCPFYYVLIKTMALMTLAKLTNTPCVQAWHMYWLLNLSSW